VTQQEIALIGLVISTVGSLVIAWLQKRGATQEATLLTAVIHGVEAGAAKSFTGDALKLAIKGVAEDRGVQALLDARVQEVTKPQEKTP